MPRLSLFLGLRDALRRKFLCFFRANLRIPQPEPKIAIISKRLKVEFIRYQASALRREFFRLLYFIFFYLTPIGNSRFKITEIQIILIFFRCWTFHTAFLAS